jgi:hypothetical protein
MKKLLIGTVAIAVMLTAGFTFVSSQQNAPPTPDLYYDFYKSHDTTPEGKVGVFLVGLNTGEDYEPAWWKNIFDHSLHTVIPWPARVFAGMDTGVALVDPNRYWEYTEFKPTVLQDQYGQQHDLDGIPYIEKWRRGQVQWQPPNPRRYLDTGFFLYDGRKSGVPSRAGKRMSIAKTWYYGSGFSNQKVPHAYQAQRVFDDAFATLTQKYGDFPYHTADSMDPWEMQREVYELLDGGIDTLVLASPMVVYSHYEEFNGSWRKVRELVQQWQQERGQGKTIKLVMAPPMGHFQPIRQGFVHLLKDRLDTLPADAKVKIAISVHGMPWDRFPYEAWLELSKPYLEPLQAEVDELVAGYAFPKTEIVVCQDHFADPIWDPEQKYLSTHRAYVEGQRDGYDYVIQQPMEFYTENTDTMFSHAHHNYEGFEGYDVYETIDYSDWDQPYVRVLDYQGTTTIYNGVMTGEYRHYVADSLAMAIDSILSQSQTLQAQAGQPLAQTRLVADGN